MEPLYEEMKLSRFKRMLEDRKSGEPHEPGEKMRYIEVRASRSGTTADYRGEDGTLVEVYKFKSGRLSYTPIEELSRSLTVDIKPESARTFESEPITAYFESQAVR